MKNGRFFQPLVIMLLVLCAGCEKCCHDAAKPSSASAISPASAKWIKTELYFGTSKPDNTTVTAAEWQEFLDKEITPAFKDGLTVVDGYGQYLNEKGVLARENSKILIVLYEPNAEKDAALSKIIAAYKKRFQQESVLRVSQPADVKFE